MAVRFKGGKVNQNKTVVKDPKGTANVDFDDTQLSQNETVVDSSGSDQSQSRIRRGYTSSSKSANKFDWLSRKGFWQPILVVVVGGLILWAVVSGLQTALHNSQENNKSTTTQLQSAQPE